MNELIRADTVALTIAFPQRHPQRDHHQVDVLAGLRMPGHDALREPEFRSWWAFGRV
jgi:hypothetical protein